ncbi:MAG: hypothetical protein LBK00_04550 [Treponema sp.]|jgi:hypothetical protein|nr:hypothetical protein [Treponema sp.]
MDALGLTAIGVIFVCAVSALVKERAFMGERNGKEMAFAIGFSIATLLAFIVTKGA